MKKFTIMLLGLVLLAAACAPHERKTKPADVAYYTCNMHPWVRSQDPDGKCPVCSMTLVPVMVNNNKPAAESGPHEFTIPLDRQQLIGVTYATAAKQPLHLTVRAVGVVTYDKQRYWNYVSRVDGYVQKLDVSARGDRVEKGQALLSIHSPDLLVAQREYIGLLRSRDEAKAAHSQLALDTAEQSIAAARHRMEFWNIGDDAIDELEKTREPQPFLTLYSPFRGVVQDLPANQGSAVKMGDQLVDVVDLSVVWIWAEFYQDELSLLKKGLPIAVTTSSYPGAKFPGKIALIDPFLNEAKRTVRVRLDVDNPDFKLLPGMYVDATLDLDLGEGLAIPVNAVLPTGTRNIVFVDKGHGKLEPRFIELGRKFGDFYAVTSGLSSGERVVNSANFLIDAESRVQGALPVW